MKLSLTWLKDYVAVGVSPEKLAHKLTMAGLEVEKILTVGAETVFELEITPNRPDCLSVLGLAREVSAVLNVSRKVPRLPKRLFPSAPCNIRILDRKGCLRYVGTLIRNVRIGQAPEWIKKRLVSLEMRSINNAVDITNFCLMETGQPLHVFDYDKLEGGKIVVRRASAGETLVTIDGIERKLDSSILVIADNKGPVAIAGVMGGKDTQVTENTKNILLESAYFDPTLIRQMARALGISSESSYRFERGVDYDMVKSGAQRAIGLLLDCTSGRLAGYSDEVVAHQRLAGPVINLQKDRVRRFLGADIPVPRCRRILQSLGFDIKASKKDILKVKPPVFREDIQEEMDVVEEIARVNGYDDLPVSLPVVKVTSLAADVRWKFRQTIRASLLAQGVNEVITYSLINEKDLARTKQTQFQVIKIQNPLASDQGILRPSLLPSLLSVAAFNINRGQKNLKLFETGRIYLSDGEKEALGILITGRHEADWRENRKYAFDFYDMKGIATQVIARVCAKDLNMENDSHPFFTAGQDVSVVVNGTPLGSLGKVADEVLVNWDIKQRNVFFVQIDLEALRSFYGVFDEKRYRSLVEYPAIVRDVSLAVNKGICFKEVSAVALRLGGGILDSVKFVEEYRGDKIPLGRRGIVFSLCYRAHDRTLREEEVNNTHEQIVRAFVVELGAIRR